MAKTDKLTPSAFPEPVYCLMLAEQARKLGYKVNVIRTYNTGDVEYARVEIVKQDGERVRVRQHGSEPVWVARGELRNVPKDKLPKPQEGDPRQVSLLGEE